MYEIRGKMKPKSHDGVFETFRIVIQRMHFNIAKSKNVQEQSTRQFINAEGKL